MESQNETQRIGAVIVAKSGKLSKERGRERDAMWKRRSRFNRRKIRTMSTKGRKRTLLLETAHFTSESALISSRKRRRRKPRIDAARKRTPEERKKKSENANESVPAKRKQRQRCQGLRERKRSKRRETVVLPQQRMNFIRDPLTLTSGN